MYYSAGKYLVKLGGHRLGESKNGTACLILNFLPIGYFTEGSDEADDVENAQSRDLYVYLSKKTFGSPEKPGIAVTTLRKLGFIGKDLAQLDPSHPDAHSFDGEKVVFALKSKEYEGKEQEDWSVGGSGTAPLREGGLSELAQFFPRLEASTADALPI